MEQIISGDTRTTEEHAKHHQPLGTGVAQHEAHPSAVFADAQPHSFVKQNFTLPQKEQLYKKQKNKFSSIL